MLFDIDSTAHLDVLYAIRIGLVEWPSPEEVLMTRFSRPVPKWCAIIPGMNALHIMNTPLMFTSITLPNSSTSWSQGRPRRGLMPALLISMSTDTFEFMTSSANLLTAA